MDIKRKSQIINFINNVVVEKDDSSLLAQRMVVVYEEKKEPGAKSQIKRIDAKEDVKIFSEEFIASGDTGYYEPAQSIFVLEKNVIVNNGTSIASGDKFIYNTITKRGHFVGKKNETSIAGNANSDKRVVVIIGNDLKDSKDQKEQKKHEQENSQR